MCESESVLEVNKIIALSLRLRISVFSLLAYFNIFFFHVLFSCGVPVLHHHYILETVLRFSTWTQKAWKVPGAAFVPEAPPTGQKQIFM